MSDAGCIPIDHVASITSTQCDRAIVVRFWHVLADPVEDVDNVLIWITSPVATDRISKVLTVAGTSGRIRGNHNVSLFSKDGRVPPGGPRVQPCTLRTAVNQVRHRIFPVAIKVTRSYDDAVDLRIDVRIACWGPDSVNLVMGQSVFAA
jgi:hypothetical protein